MKKTIRAHHGSPGSPKDFIHLKENFEEYDFKLVDRFNKKSKFEEPSILLGYSFGCYHALEEASQNIHQTKGIILVAPFVFPDESPSTAMKFLLGLPTLGDFILNKVAPTRIQNMLKESSHPHNIPASYQDNSSIFSNPKVLRASLFEKDFDKRQFIEKLSLIKAANIPILVLAGDHDKTSGDTQKRKLEEFLDFSFGPMANAGHALPWTHPKEVSKKIREFIKREEIMDHKLGYFPGKSEYNNVAAFLKEHIQKIPHRPILSWVDMNDITKWDFNLNTPLPHKSVSVLELDQMVGHLCSGFKNLGIKEGDRVVVFIPMSLYMYAAMFALQKMGAIAVFMDSWARRDQLGLAIKVVDAKAMISVEKAFVYFGEDQAVKDIPLKIVAGPAQGSYDGVLEQLMQSPDYAQITPVEKEHTALITFTTGSSGTPKGADRGHRFLAAQHYALNRHIPYQDSDVDLPVFPIFSLNNLAAGVTTILPAIDVGVPSEKDALILIAQMKSTKTTCTTLSPSLLRSVYNFCLENELKLDFLKRIVTGGAPVSRDDLLATIKIAPNAEILVLYGSTEVEPMAHIKAREMVSFKESSDPEIVEAGVNVGKFDEGLRVRTLKINKGNITINNKEDWNDLCVEEGGIGEIIVSGEHVCENYYNNPEAFSKAKIRDEEGVVWHRTGDLGRLDDDNNLWLVGRVHNAINRGGVYQFPVRAEIVMGKLPFVAKAAYLGVSDEELGEKTIAVFSTQEEADADKINEYKSEIKRIMDKNEIIIDKIVYTDDIPMDPRHHSKVEYGVLRETLMEKGEV